MGIVILILHINLKVIIILIVNKKKLCLFINFKINDKIK